MINQQKFEIFPTLVTQYSGILSREQCTSIYEYCLLKASYDHQAIVGNGTSSHMLQDNILLDISNNVISCKNLYETVEKVLNTFCKDINIDAVKIVNSWFNIQNKSILSQHFHPSSVISAAIYINIDKNSTKLYLENPNTLIQYLNSKNIKNKFTQEFFSIEPEMGDLVIFPSYIKHGSLNTINNTINRMVISLNAV